MYVLCINVQEQTVVTECSDSNLWAVRAEIPGFIPDEVGFSLFRWHKCWKLIFMCENIEILGCNLDILNR